MFFWGVVLYGVIQAIAESQRIAFREEITRPINQDIKSEPSTAKREETIFINNTSTTVNPLFDNTEREKWELLNGKETINGNSKTIEFDVIYR